MAAFWSICSAIAGQVDVRPLAVSSAFHGGAKAARGCSGTNCRPAADGCGGEFATLPLQMHDEVATPPRNHPRSAEREPGMQGQLAHPPSTSRRGAELGQARQSVGARMEPGEPLHLANSQSSRDGKFEQALRTDATRGPAGLFEWSRHPESADWLAGTGAGKASRRPGSTKRVRRLDTSNY